MAKGYNKKILFFIDEFGTAGVSDLYFGGVIALAKDTGRLDKCFSDRLETNAKEIHAVTMSDEYLKDLMMRFKQTVYQENFILINRSVSIRQGAAPIIYAQGLIETVKVGLKLFRKEVLKSTHINNVEVITDINHHNSHPDFENEISKEKSKDREFSPVNHLARIDSAASRMLQIADIVAYSRKFIINKDLNAEQLKRDYGIHIK
jgi:hypothetical protein